MNVFSYFVLLVSVLLSNQFVVWFIENSSDNDGSTSNDDVATNETINFITKNECGFGKIESQVTLTVELCESNEVTESKFSDNHSQDSGFSDVQGSENKSAELSERF